MTVAFDAATEPATFTTTTPYTFSHTPSGTPAGILLEIDHGSTASDLINGAVTYGGVAMERVATSDDTATEAGRSYLYFLGAGVPTGTQTVSISHTGSGDTKHTTVASVTAASDVEIGGAGGWSENITNPAVTLGRYQEGLGFVVVYSGTPNVADLTPLANMSTISDNDYGAFMSRFDRETTASTGAFPIGYTTALNDDVALCAVSIQEQQSGCYPAGAMSPITGCGIGGDHVHDDDARPVKRDRPLHVRRVEGFDFSLRGRDLHRRFRGEHLDISRGGCRQESLGVLEAMAPPPISGRRSLSPRRLVRRSGPSSA